MPTKPSPVEPRFIPAADSDITSDFQRKRVEAERAKVARSMGIDGNNLFLTGFNLYPAGPERELARVRPMFQQYENPLFMPDAPEFVPKTADIRRDQARKRLKDIDTVEQNLLPVAGLMKLGMISKEELTIALSPTVGGSKVLDIDAIGRNLTRLKTRAASDAVVAMAGQDVGVVAGTAKLALNNLVMGLSSLSGEAFDFTRDIQARLQTAVTGKAPTQDPAQEELMKGMFTELSRPLAKTFGLPTDPHEREIYKANLPMSSQIAAELVEVLVWSALTRGLPAATQGAGAVGKGTALQNLLSRTPIGSRLTSRLPAVLAASGTGGIFGYSASALMNPEAGRIDHFTNAARGAAAGFFLQGLLKGRPWGQVHRAIHWQEIRKLSSPGPRQMFANIGTAFKAAPRMTVGHMLEAGTIGAAFRTSKALQEGAEPLDAIQQGVGEGLLWMGGDILGAGIGAGLRWQGVFAKVASEKLVGRITALQNYTQVGGKVLRAGGNTALGATLGYTQAKARGTDPVEGAIIGAVGTQLFLGYFQRIGSILPRSTLTKLAKGGLSGFTPKEVADLAEATFRDVVESTAAELPPAEREIMLRALGRTTSTDKERAILAELTQVEALIRQYIPDENIAGAEPSKLAAVTVLARRAGELHEQLYHAANEAADDVTLDITTDAGAAFVRGKKINDLYRLSRNAKQEFEAQTAQRAAARAVREARLDQVQAKAEARAKDQTLAAKSANELDRIGELNREFNTAQRVASDVIRDMPFETVLNEISVATGRSLEDVRSEFQVFSVTTTDALGRVRKAPFEIDPESAIAELSHLRASAGDPNAPITKAIIRRSGLTADHKAALAKRDLLESELADLASTADAGEMPTIQKIRSVLARVGGTIRQDKTNPLYHTADIPFIGEITDTLPAIIRKARLFLRDYKPALILGGLAVGAPLAEASTKIEMHGLIGFDDMDERKPGLAFWGTAATVASLAAVGLVLNKHFPTRIRAFPRALREFMKRQDLKEVKGKPGEYDAREAVFSYWTDGTATVKRGVTDSAVDIGQRVFHKGRAILFSVHNHTSSLARILRDHPNASRQDKITTAFGMELVNELPSASDIVTHAGFSPANNTSMHFAIVTPRVGKITLVAFDPRKVLETGIAAIDAPRRVLRTQAHGLQQQQRAVNRIETQQLRILRKMIDRLKAVGVAPSHDRLWNAKGWIVANHAKIYGEDTTVEMLLGMYRGFDVRIKRGITDEQLENILAAVHKYTRETPALTTAQLAASRIAISSPVGGATALRASTDNTFLDTIERAFYGTIPDGADDAAKALRRMAPAGAQKIRRILPSSVTPESAAKPGQTLHQLQQWGVRHGIRFIPSDSGGKRSINAVIGDVVVTESDTISGMIENIQRLAKQDTNDATRSLMNMQNERLRTMVGRKGAERLGAFTKFGGAAGGIVSAFTAGMFNNFFLTRRSDRDPDYTPAVMGAVLGTIGGALIGAALGARTNRHFKLNAIGQAAVTLFAPLNTELLPPGTVQKLLGKSSSAKSKTGKRIKGKGPTKAQFFAMPVAAQVEHLRLRLRAVVSTANTDSADKQKHLLRTVAKFTPTHFESGRQYDKLMLDVVSSALETGFNEEAAINIWMGMVSNMLTPYTFRAKQTMPANLFSLSKRIALKVEDPGNLNELRQVMTTARIMSGPDVPRPRGSIRSSKENLKMLLTPEAENWKTIQALAGMSDIKNRLRDDNVAARMFSSLLPPEQFRTIANRLRNTPGKEGTAQDIDNLFTSTMAATEFIRTETDEALVKLKRIFAGMNDPAKRKKVRKVMEDPAYREKIKVEDPSLYRRAVEFRQLLDEYAARLEMPEGLKIEDYFPHIYSTRTIESLRASGRIPTDIVIPIGYGLPEYKILRQMLNRHNADPLGNIIEDPLEVGLIYLQGAVRKQYMDRLVGQFGSKFFRELGEREPFVAADMARWVLDVFGMPSPARVKAMTLLRGMGVRIEELAQTMGLSGSDLTNDFIDRYFLGPGAQAKFSNALRGIEFVSKLGFSFISALVNLSQLPANTGTDLGMAEIFIGGTSFLAQSTRGKLHESLADKGFARLAGWIDPNLTGTRKYNMAVEMGVFSDNTKRMLDELDRTLVRQQRVSRKKGGAIGGVLALGPSMLLGNDRGDERTKTVVGGVAGGIGLGMLSPRLFRYALSKARDIVIMPFETVEAINRGMTAGGAEFTAKLVQRTGPTGKGANALRVAEGLETALLGGAAGAGFAAVTERRGKRLEGAKAGGALGVGIGAAVALAGRKAGRVTRVARELANIEDQFGSIPLRKVMLEEGPPTPEEIRKWYMRQVLDQTQFRFGREGRPQLLRTQTGEILGALQTFTLNQAEFVGSRYASFVDSIAQQTGIQGGVRSAAASGQLDTRVFRHLILLAGVGAAMTGLSMGLESDRSPEYWLSRIGFGLLPVINYNEDAEVWGLSDIGQHLKGPIINDFENGVKTVWRLATDPVAARKWDLQLDELARGFVSALRQIEKAPDVVSAGLEKLQAERLAEFVQGQQKGASEIARPFSTARHGRPRGGRRPGKADDRGGFNTGGGGFEGGF